MMMNYFMLFAAVLSLAYGQNDGTIRLVRNGLSGNSFTSGIVQVYYDGEWSGVCRDDTFSETEAGVICHQLGYTGAQSFSNAGEEEYGSIANANYTDVQCLNEDYQVLFQCSYNRGDCNPDQAVNVNCVNTRLWDDPYTGQVRLQKGAYSNQGVVEIYCNDEWGTVCDDGFGQTDAETVCDQLGYNSATITTSYSGNATQPIWLRNVDCSIFSSCLTSCQSCPSTAVTICSHSEDVSVECSYDSSLTSDGQVLGACDFTDLAAAIGRLIGIIVGVIIGLCALVIFLTVLPLCICCCLGVGIGAAASRA